MASYEPENEDEMTKATDLGEELDTINNELQQILDSMSSTPIHPGHKAIMDQITRVVDHVVLPKGRLVFQVTFGTNEFGGPRWMSAKCLRYRPEVVATYWNKLAVEAFQKEERNRLAIMGMTSVFGVYDF